MTQPAPNDTPASALQRLSDAVDNRLREVCCSKRPKGQRKVRFRADKSARIDELVEFFKLIRAAAKP